MPTEEGPAWADNSIPRAEKSRTSFYTWSTVAAVVYLAGVAFLLARGFVPSAVALGLVGVLTGLVLAFFGRRMGERFRRTPRRVRIRHDAVDLELRGRPRWANGAIAIEIPLNAIERFEEQPADLTYIPRAFLFRFPALPAVGPAKDQDKQRTNTGRVYLSDENAASLRRVWEARRRAGNPANR